MSRFQKLFLIFIIGSVFGCYWEMFLNLITHWIFSGEIFWEIRSGVIYGPLSTVYGAGAVIITYFLADRNLKWHQIFCYGALLCGIAEYFVSFLQQTFTGATSWNYSAHVLNLNGRTSLPVMLVWGLICLVFVQYVYPLLSRLIDQVKPTPAVNLFLNFAIVLVCLDMFISYSAVVRQHLRRNDVQTFTPYGQFLDNVYPDTRMKRAYPNMKIME